MLLLFEIFTEVFTGGWKFKKNISMQIQAAIKFKCFHFFVFLIRNQANDLIASLRMRLLQYRCMVEKYSM